jgi:glucose/arabinose dehydrogenase
MGLVLDPSFDTNRRFYTCQGHDGPEIQVIGWTVDAGWTSATRVIDPLVSGIPASSGRHGGCRLRFDNAGQLLIGTGDAAIGTNPQNLASLGGKLLRVDPVTGQGSSDNPFAVSANANTRRVYTYGHRNVQGVAIRPGDGRIFTVEHGPSRDDEINQIVAGGNYGWNPVPGYNEGVPMTDHVAFPSAIGAVWASGSPTLATSGATFLDGAAWRGWNGALAVASLKNATLRLFFFDAAGRLTRQVVVPELNNTYGRLRTAELGPDGALYVATANGSNDRILRITPS